jgi:hypothetical protein
VNYNANERNDGFEKRDFTGWMQVGNTGFTGVYG